MNEENNQLYNLFNIHLYKNDIVLIDDKTVQPENFSSGSISGDIEYKGGYIQSANFVEDNVGWKLSSDGTLKAVNVELSGTITATAGAIGGFTIASTTLSGGTGLVLSSSGEGIITGGTIRTASSGERIQIKSDTTRLEAINSNGDIVAKLFFGTAGTDAILRLNSVDDERRALEIITDAALGSDSNAIVIDNRADSTAIDLNQNGDGIGIDIANNSGTKEAIYITSQNSSSSAIRVAGGSSNAAILVERSFEGIKITSTSTSTSDAIVIDEDSNSSAVRALDIDRDGNATSDVSGIRVNCANAGTGRGIGIDLTNTDSAFKFASDATDPTSGGGAATGRVPIEIGGTTYHLAYY